MHNAQCRMAPFEQRTLIVHTEVTAARSPEPGAWSPEPGVRKDIQ